MPFIYGIIANKNNSYGEDILINDDEDVFLFNVNNFN